MAKKKDADAAKALWDAITGPGGLKPDDAKRLVNQLAAGRRSTANTQDIAVALAVVMHGNASGAPTPLISLERWLERYDLAAGGESHMREIIQISNDPSLTAEEKCRAIKALDRTMTYTSDQWGVLVGVTGAAIRGLDFWDEEQHAAPDKARSAVKPGSIKHRPHRSEKLDKDASAFHKLFEGHKPGTDPKS